MLLAISKLDRARRLAAVAHVVALVALVLLSLAILVNHLIPSGAALLSGPGPFAERLSAALIPLISVLPLAFFWSAMFRLRQALEYYGDGDFFAAKSSHKIATAGQDAALALAAMAVIVPTLQAWVSGGRGLHIDFEHYMLAMLAFALFVMVVGRILAAAAEIKAENDEIV